MATPTDDEKRKFGEVLRELIGDEPMKDVVTRLGENGLDVPYATFSGWARGESTPRNRRVVRQLDDHLLGEGRLLGALNLRYPRPQSGSLIEAGGRETDIGQLVLRRIRGEDLTEVEEDALEAIDAESTGGDFVIESALYSLSLEVDGIRQTLDERLARIEQRLGIRHLQAADTGNPPDEPGRTVNRPSPDPEPEGP